MSHALSAMSDEHMAELTIEIDPQEVLRLQGYRRPADVPTAQVLDILRDAMGEARQVFRPRWTYQEFQVGSAGESGVCLQGGPELSIREIPMRWGLISTVGLAVCTIGDALENRIEALFAAREFPVAYMLDSLGSVAVEALGEALHRQICEDRLAQGLKITPRESPGYGRWPIEDQQKIFALLPGETIGVHLNAYSIMTPRKSISFGVGIGRDASMGTGGSPCRSCDMRDCAYRRAPRRHGIEPAWVAKVAPLVLAANTG
jgi:hypothetical protein